jgi:hypothetical protein
VTATVRGWYGARERVVQLVSATAMWYHSGMPALPMRWVLVRDPREAFAPQAVLGLFSMITLWAGQVAQEHALPIRQAIGYRKVQPTFADAIAVVRQHLWTSTHFYMSPAKPDMVEIPSALLNRLTETLCYAA